MGKEKTVNEVAAELVRAMHGWTMRDVEIMTEATMEAWASVNKITGCAAKCVFYAKEAKE